MMGPVSFGDRCDPAFATEIMFEIKNGQLLVRTGTYISDCSLGSTSMIIFKLRPTAYFISLPYLETNITYVYEDKPLVQTICSELFPSRSNFTCEELCTI
jgi:hypothetical protein